MASLNKSTIAKAKNTYYQSKLRTITILTLNNYLEFLVLVVLALIAEGNKGLYRENRLIQMKIRTPKIKRLAKL